MKSEAIVRYAEPLQEITGVVAEPTGTEVLMRVTHCGVCHSDVHLHDGYFDLGGDRKADLSAGHTLPFTMGHEIQGEVAALGADAEGVVLGQKLVVYPWIGCGECEVCAGGEEQMCGAPRTIGVNVAGGFSDYVLVPHPRYLLNFDGIADGLAATYMCSGLTAYSALKKLESISDGDDIAIVGLGGVGFMGVQFARALFPAQRIIGVDVDATKLEAALTAGADAVYDSSDKGAAKELLKATGGGCRGAVDFVGSEGSIGFATRVIKRGGKAVIVGLFGGTFSIPIPMFPLRSISIAGSMVGSLGQAKAMLELVKSGVVDPIPLKERPLSQANQTLNDLRDGKVLGRVVLRP
jgi:D-arabinose 1-dehydrogenase-like Zn-dependent alcohol dehydrogenase